MSGTRKHEPKLTKPIGIVALPFVPVPPNLEAVFGYKFDRRCVAFYWDDEDGTLCFSDGVHAACGSGYAYPTGWHLYVTHPSVAKGLSGINVYGEADADHALLLDRKERRLYAATIQDARDVVAGKYLGQPRNPMQFSFPTELGESFFAAAQSAHVPTDRDTALEAILGRAEARMRAEVEMIGWLDQLERDGQNVYRGCDHHCKEGDEAR